MTRWAAAVGAIALMAAACGGSSGSSGSDDSGGRTDEPTTSTDATGEAIDLTRLPVGDDRVSDEPGVGALFSCMTMFNDPGGAGTEGPWFNGDGTWDATTKATITGAVEWPSEFDVRLEGGSRVVTGNDLPDHTTGEYPVSADDPARQYDANPNAISAQDVALELPANPTLADEPQCAGGEVGVLLTGSLVFSAIDAGGRDAVAHEVQDACDGHPQNSGVYHYHSVSDCATDDHGDGHSELVGYAFDGFGIFGHYGVDGETLTNDNLDECHGHTHEIEWDGQTIEMYHYHATHEYPYTVGCFRGATTVSFGGAASGGPPAGGPPAP